MTPELFVKQWAVIEKGHFSTESWFRLQPVGP